jgi:hypothetical protein
VDLETDTIFLKRAFLNSQVRFGFEFTNGNTPLSVGDTIIIKGNIGTIKFPYDDNDPDNPKITYSLTKDLEPGTTIQIAQSQWDPEELQSYSNVIQHEGDSLHRATVCGTLIYVSKYSLTKDTVKCVDAILAMEKTGEEPAVLETVMAKVKFYPNPVSDNLYITNLKNMNVEVYNMVGQRVSHFENVSGDLTVNMKIFPDGIYFVKLQNGQTVRTEKIKLVK